MKRIGYIDGRRMSFLDDFLLTFGTGKDITFGWDGAALNILPLTNDIGAINFGDGDKQVDVKIFLGSTVKYALFDVGESRVDIVGVDLALGDTRRLYFGDDDDFSIYWTGDAGGWLNIVAATGGSVSFYAPGGVLITGPVTVNDAVTIAALLTAGAIACNGDAGIAGTLTAGALACNGNASVAGVLTAGEVQCNGNMGVAGILGVAAHLIITNIPIADPNVAGELWDNGGVVTRSHG